MLKRQTSEGCGHRREPDIRTMGWQVEVPAREWKLKAENSCLGGRSNKQERMDANCLNEQNCSSDWLVRSRIKRCLDFLYLCNFFACVLMLVAISLPQAYAGSAYGSFDCCQLGCVLVRWAGICALLSITELEVCSMTIAGRGKTALQPCNLVWAWWKCTRQTTKLTLEWLVAVSLLVKTWTSLIPPVPG